MDSVSDPVSVELQPARCGGVAVLSAEEGRVLAVLVEKQHTVPDTYPLSLNALAAGCNQKTARDPVMDLAEPDLLLALNGLKERSLVFEVSGNRVTRFEHNLRRVYGVPGAAEALLAVLLLRGPQTTAELRLNCERLHRFADLSSAEGFLEELLTKGLVTRLARSPGAREPRWAQLLTGAVSGVEAAGSASAASAADAVPWQALRDEIEALKARVALLEGRLP